MGAILWFLAGREEASTLSGLAGHYVADDVITPARPEAENRYGAITDRPT